MKGKTTADGAEAVSMLSATTSGTAVFILQSPHLKTCFCQGLLSCLWKCSPWQITLTRLCSTPLALFCPSFLLAKFYNSSTREGEAEAEETLGSRPLWV